MSDCPLISIVTTLYNYARYIGELADSVALQTYRNWEWIVIDDASTDAPIITLPSRFSTRLRYVRLSENRGYSAAKNVGLRMAQGEYFVMIDADDVLLPNSLQLRYDALSQQPHKQWVHADALNYNAYGEIERTYIRWNNNKRRELLDKGVDLTRTYHHRLIHAQTVMLRRGFHEKLGLYDESLRFSSDNEMWRRAIRFGVIPTYVPEPVAIYRAHDKRMSRSQYKKQLLKQTKEYIKDIVERRFNDGLVTTNTPVLEPLA